MEELQQIKGGWKNVPEGWYTKTQLSKMGLKPTGGPMAEVWSYHDWVFLYDIKETKEKRKPSEKQLAALELARKKKEEYEIQRLKEEEEARWREYKERQREYGMATFGAWYEQDFLILDTETTDLNGEIIEIAIIDKNENVLFDSLIKPKGSISPEAFNVHGISEEMLKDAPTWMEVWPEIKEIIKDKLILIYNDTFDRQMIYNSCDAWELESISLSTDCVMRSYADYWESRWVNLSKASGNWTSHRALGDCFDTLKVIRDMWSELGLVEFEKAQI